MASLFKPTYTAREPATGNTDKKRSAKWYVKYRDADGIIRRVPGYTDKEATLQLAAQLEKRAALQAVGVVDRFAESRKRPLSTLISLAHSLSLRLAFRVATWRSLAIPLSP